MDRFIFGFCISCLSALLWPVLPAQWCLPYLLFFVVIFVRKAPSVSGVLFAVWWLSIYFYSLDFQPKMISNNKTTISAQIVSLVSGHRDWISADVRLIEPKLTSFNVSQLWRLPWADKHYRLTWQTPPEVRVGQIWQLDVKLKPITSIANQGGFN